MEQGCCKGQDLPPEQTWAAAVLKARTRSACQSSKGAPVKINVHADGCPAMFNHLHFNSLVYSGSQSPRKMQINEISSWPCAMGKSPLWYTEQGSRHGDCPKPNDTSLAQSQEGEPGPGAALPMSISDGRASQCPAAHEECRQPPQIFPIPRASP